MKCPDCGSEAWFSTEDRDGDPVEVDGSCRDDRGHLCKLGDAPCVCMECGYEGEVSEFLDNSEYDDDEPEEDDSLYNDEYGEDEYTKKRRQEEDEDDEEEDSSNVNFEEYESQFESAEDDED